MSKAILKTNTHAIENDMRLLSNKRATFQPLLDAMIENDFLPTTAEFQNMIWGKANNEKDGLLLLFLQSKTVARTEAIERLPIREEAKRSMIQLPKSCDAIFNEFAKLPTQKEALRDLFKFEINENAQLELTPKSKQDVIDKWTLYGAQKQMDALEAAHNLIEAMKSFSERFGVGVLSTGIVNQTFDSRYSVNEMAIIMNVK